MSSLPVLPGLNGEGRINALFGVAAEKRKIADRLLAISSNREIDLDLKSRSE